MPLLLFSQMVSLKYESKEHLESGTFWKQQKLFLLSVTGKGNILINNHKVCQINASLERCCLPKMIT